MSKLHERSVFTVDTPAGRFCFFCAYIISVNLSGLHLCAIRTHDVDVSDSSCKCEKKMGEKARADGGQRSFCEQGLGIFFSRDLSPLLIPRIYISILTRLAQCSHSEARERD